MRLPGSILTFSLTVTGTLFGQLTITNSPPPGTVGTSYPTAQASGFQFTATGGSLNYNWQWFPQDTPNGQIPPGLNLGLKGLITGTPSQQGNFPVQVQVTDNQNQQLFGSQNFTISISPCAPTFVTTSPLPQGELNIRYSQTIQATAGCATPYAFSTASNPLSPNTLPAWATLASSGPTTAVVEGIPDTAGTSNFNITVTEASKDPNPGSATNTFSLTINPPPSITTTSPLPNGVVKVPYPQLQLTATGGVGKLTFLATVPAALGLIVKPDGTISGTPTNAGIFQIIVQVRDGLGVVSQTATLQITINPNVPNLQVSPSSLTFSAFAGGSTPTPQAISLAPVAAATSPVAFRVLVDGGAANTSAPFSLTVNPANGTAPAQLIVNVDQGTTQGGTLQARIRIFDSVGLEIDVPVSLTVTAGSPKLQVIPSMLRFAATTQSPGSFEQDLAITSSGGGGSIGFSAAVVGGSSWISNVTPKSGQTVKASVFIRVLVSTQGLKVGSYRDLIRITFPGGQIDIPVSLFVASSGPILGVNVTGVRYQAQQGGGFSNAQTVKILNLGDPASTVHWTAQLVSGADVVSLGAGSGTATAANPGLLTLGLSPGATQLAFGGHYALVRISDTNALNSPVYIIVVLDLAQSGTPALPDLSPAGLYFVVVAGGAQSTGQTVKVNTSSASPAAFQVAAATDDGGAWLLANPAAGTSTGQTAGTFSVAVDPSHLAQSIHAGQVSVSMNGIVRTVNVTVVVLPAGSSTGAAPEAASTETLRPFAVGCTPGKLAITETGLVNNFAVPAKWPATLIVQLNDDCGGSVANGAVVAGFSNGDAPLSLRGDGAGNYSATWQPGSATPEMVVTLNATAGTLQPATMQLAGGIALNQNAAPVLAAGGTVNAFYRVLGGALSPGTIVEVYGTGLASASASTGAPPLPTTFNGTNVLVGGLQAPLFFLSDGQLDVQIPNELPPNQQYPIIVIANGAVTLPDQLDVVPLQPSVDAFVDGHLVAQHGADFSLVTAGNPAKPGEALVIYLLGMGLTDRSVPSGAPAPSNPLANALVQPTVSIDGQFANVAFAGLTPTFAGLYQINFQVPSTARSGDLTVVVSQNGVAANATTLQVAH